MYVCMYVCNQKNTGTNNLPCAVGLQCFCFFKSCLLAKVTYGANEKSTLTQNSDDIRVG